ncbi:hypothetical protein C8R46DRAFT_1044567 [Mycena filopes]|nr:hypothetical protein C8R46DRAFT_1044567 [Mycena filopes]
MPANSRSKRPRRESSPDPHRDRDDLATKKIRLDPADEDPILAVDPFTLISSKDAVLAQPKDYKIAFTNFGDPNDDSFNDTPCVDLEYPMRGTECTVNLIHKLYLTPDQRTIVKSASALIQEAFISRDGPTLFRGAVVFNHLLHEIKYSSSDGSNSFQAVVDSWVTKPKDLVKHILTETYNRCIGPHFGTLRAYPPWTSSVYIWRTPANIC